MYVLTQIGHSVLRRICLYYIPYEYGDRLFGVWRGGGRRGKLLRFLKHTEIVNISSTRKPVMRFVPVLWSIVRLAHSTFWHDHISWYAGIEIRPGTSTARYTREMTWTAFRPFLPWENYHHEPLAYGREERSCGVNPLNPELNPICYLLALLAHHFLHVSRMRVKSLTLRLLMSYIYIYIYIYITLVT